MVFCLSNRGDESLAGKGVDLRMAAAEDPARSPRILKKIEFRSALVPIAAKETFRMVQTAEKGAEGGEDQKNVWSQREGRSKPRNFLSNGKVLSAKIHRHREDGSHRHTS